MMHNINFQINGGWFVAIHFISFAIIEINKGDEDSVCV